MHTLRAVVFRRRGSGPAASGGIWVGRQPAALLLATLLIGAAILRIFWLGRESVWTDELFSRKVSTGAFGPAMRTVQEDLVHPPLYYLALRVVLHMGGDTVFSLRLLSLVSGLALIGLVSWWAAALVRNWKCGLFAGLLLALSPVQIYYSQEARSYSFYSLLVVGMAVLFHHWMLRPDQLRRWAAFSFLAAAALMTHYVAAVFFASTLPSVLASKFRRSVAPQWAASGAVAGGLLGAWIGSIWPYYRRKGGLDQNLSWIETPSMYQGAAVFAEFNGLPPFRGATALTLSVALLLVALGITRMLKSGSWSRETSPHSLPRFPWILVGGLALLPTAFLFAASQPPLSIPLWGMRHVLPSQAFWAVGIAALVWEVRKGAPRAGAALGGVFLLLQLAALYPNLQRPFRVPYSGIAEMLSRDPRPHTVYSTWTGIAGPVNYYLRSSAGSVRPLDSAERLPDEFWLLYRPAVSSEAAHADSLRERGWRVEKKGHFGGEYGTTAAFLRRRNP